MKKINVFIAGAFFLLLSMGANAQAKTGAGYFSGSWNVLVKGTPNGDSKMILVLEKKDSLMTGVVQDSTGKEMAKISSAELKETQLTVYFTTQGYDVNLVMDKKDEDHTTGSLMGMFDAEADRIKNAK
ncbi:hypothetical protein QWZ08_13295 [Ferruginibacter paludis]|uniref:hypothetical protein n=1 Tax=Ferruginibacter paludis TaxID=1310417 RepID=UPI0025B51F71|nr:hypothetical protein [Ferruginibacter paludis]MDN3656614.1 hypothetical protein [Ferruginibacter paludis]